MKISSLLTIGTLVTIFAACNSADKKAEPSDKAETPFQTVNNLSGHVYYFGPALDSTKCEVRAECDCCSDDFLFLNEKDFIRVGYCVAEKSAIKGTYSIGQDNLVLQYDSLTYFTEADNNNEIKTVSKGSSEYLIKSEKGKSFQDTLTKVNCKEKLFYKNSDEKSFGTISSKDSINILIDELKKEGFWKKMNLN
jgi:hypothetical protein